MNVLRSGYFAVDFLHPHFDCKLDLSACLKSYWQVLEILFALFHHRESCLFWWVFWGWVWVVWGTGTDERYQECCVLQVRSTFSLGMREDLLIEGRLSMWKKRRIRNKWFYEISNWIKWRKIYFNFGDSLIINWMLFSRRISHLTRTLKFYPQLPRFFLHTPKVPLRFYFSNPNPAAQPPSSTIFTMNNVYLLHLLCNIIKRLASVAMQN